ncbi:MAG: helix-turn-helix domain-containing protein, partial [Candidatus Omnitrophota bacterium]
MEQYRKRHNIWFRAISAFLVCAFTVTSIPHIEEAQALAPWAGTEKVAVRRETIRKILEKECPLDITYPPEIANDHLKVLRAIIHAEIKAIMQIMAKEDEYRYQGLKELILPQKRVLRTYYNLFLGGDKPVLPPNLLLNDIVARAFELLTLSEQDLISESEMSSEEWRFIQAIKPIIMSNKHNYFTGEFWDWNTRELRIRVALANGQRFDLVRQPVSGEAGEDGREEEDVRGAVEALEKALCGNIAFIRTLSSKHDSFFLSGVPDDVAKAVFEKMRESREGHGKKTLVISFSDFVKQTKETSPLELTKRLEEAYSAFFIYGYLPSKEGDYTAEEALFALKILRYLFQNHDGLENGIMVFSASEFDQAQFTLNQRQESSFPLFNFPQFFHYTGEKIVSYYPRYSTAEPLNFPQPPKPHAPGHVATFFELLYSPEFIGKAVPFEVLRQRVIIEKTGKPLSVDRAQRDLARLVKADVIEKKGKGANAQYRATIDRTHKDLIDELQVALSSLNADASTEEVLALANDIRFDQVASKKRFIFHSAEEVAKKLKDANLLMDKDIQGEVLEFAKRIDRLGIKPGQRVLDIGPGINFYFGLVLMLYGCEVHVVEPVDYKLDLYISEVKRICEIFYSSDPEEAKKAIARIHPIFGYLRNVNSDVRYDVVVAMNILDLLVIAECFEDLNRLWKSLADKAIMVVSVMGMIDAVKKAAEEAGFNVTVETDRDGSHYLLQDGRSHYNVFLKKKPQFPSTPPNRIEEKADPARQPEEEKKTEKLNQNENQLDTSVKPVGDGLEPVITKEYIQAIWGPRFRSRNDSEVLELTDVRRNRFSIQGYEIITRFFPSNAEKILEAGSGSGANLIEWAKQYPNREAVGVDIVEEALETASRGAQLRDVANVRFIRGDIRHQPFAENFFDAVFSQGVIEHYGHEDIKQIIGEKLRITKPGGTVIASVHNFRCPSVIFSMWWNSIDWRDVRKNDTYRKWRYGYDQPQKAEDIKKIFEEFGLTDIEIDGYALLYGFGVYKWNLKNNRAIYPWYAPLLRVFVRVVEPLINLVDKCTNRWISRHFGFEFVIKGVKPIPQSLADLARQPLSVKEATLAELQRLKSAGKTKIEVINDMQDGQRQRITIERALEYAKSKQLFLRDDGEFHLFPGRILRPDPEEVADALGNLARQHTEAPPAATQKIKIESVKFDRRNRIVYIEFSHNIKLIRDKNGESVVGRIYAEVHVDDNYKRTYGKFVVVGKDKKDKKKYELDFFGPLADAMRRLISNQWPKIEEGIIKIERNRQKKDRAPLPEGPRDPAPPAGNASTRHSGFIREGKQAQREFKAQLGQIRQNDITEQYKGTLIGLLEMFLSRANFTAADKANVVAIIKKIAQNKFRVYGFNSIVAGKNNFFMGWNNIKNNELFIAIDMIKTLEYGLASLVNEYLLHEVICPIFGHYPSIILLQSVFPAHYDAGNYEEKDGIKYLPGHRGDINKPYKGLLGEWLRFTINQKATVSFEKPYQRCVLPCVAASKGSDGLFIEALETIEKHKELKDFAFTIDDFRQRRIGPSKNERQELFGLLVMGILEGEESGEGQSYRYRLKDDYKKEPPEMKEKIKSILAEVPIKAGYPASLEMAKRIVCVRKAGQKVRRIRNLLQRVKDILVKRKMSLGVNLINAYHAFPVTLRQSGVVTGADVVTLEMADASVRPNREITEEEARIPNSFWTGISDELAQMGLNTKTFGVNESGVRHYITRAYAFFSTSVREYDDDEVPLELNEKGKYRISTLGGKGKEEISHGKLLAALPQVVKDKLEKVKIAHLSRTENPFGPLPLLLFYPPEPQRMDYLMLDIRNRLIPLFMEYKIGLYEQLRFIFEEFIIPTLVVQNDFRQMEFALKRIRQRLVDPDRNSSKRHFKYVHIGGARHGGSLEAYWNLLKDAGFNVQHYLDYRIPIHPDKTLHSPFYRDLEEVLSMTWFDNEQKEVVFDRQRMCDYAIKVLESNEEYFRKILITGYSQARTKRVNREHSKREGKISEREKMRKERAFWEWEYVLFSMPLGILLRLLRDGGMFRRMSDRDGLSPEAQEYLAATDRSIKEILRTPHGADFFPASLKRNDKKEDTPDPTPPVTPLEMVQREAKILKEELLPILDEMEALAGQLSPSKHLSETERQTLERIAELSGTRLIHKMTKRLSVERKCEKDENRKKFITIIIWELLHDIGTMLVVVSGNSCLDPWQSRLDEKALEGIRNNISFAKHTIIGLNSLTEVRLRADNKIFIPGLDDPSLYTRVMRTFEEGIVECPPAATPSSLHADPAQAEGPSYAKALEGRQAPVQGRNRPEPDARPIPISQTETGKQNLATRTKVHYLVKTIYDVDDEDMINEAVSGNIVEVAPGQMAIVDLQGDERIITENLFGCAALIGRGKIKEGQYVYILAHLVGTRLRENMDTVLSVLKRYSLSELEVYFDGLIADKLTLMMQFNMLQMELLSHAKTKVITYGDKNAWREKFTIGKVTVNKEGFSFEWENTTIGEQPPSPQLWDTTKSVEQKRDSAPSPEESSDPTPPAGPAREFAPPDMSLFGMLRRDPWDRLSESFESLMQRVRGITPWGNSITGPIAWMTRGAGVPEDIGKNPAPPNVAGMSLSAASPAIPEVVVWTPDQYLRGSDYDRCIAQRCIWFFLRKGVKPNRSLIADIYQEIFAAFAEKRNKSANVSEDDLYSSGLSAASKLIRGQHKASVISLDGLASEGELPIYDWLLVKDMQSIGTNTFKERVKLLRLEMCLTQKELAIKVGVTQHAVQMWENGKNMPNPQHISKLAEVLQTSVSHLVADMPEGALMNICINEEDSPGYRKLLGLKIKLLRYKAGLFQNEVAKKIGASRGIVNNWEIGRHVPRPFYLPKLAEVLQATVSQLLVGLPEETLMSARIDNQDSPGEMKCFGLKIRVLRYKLGLTQQELAERIGASFGSVARWEKGESFPLPKNMPKLVEVLQTTVSQLIVGTPEEKLMNMLVKSENSPESKKLLGLKIRILRYSMGLTREQLAKKAGAFDSHQVKYWEEGRIFPRHHMQKLALALQTTVGQLIIGVSEEKVVNARIEYNNADKKAFGAKIRILRYQSGLTIKEIANAMSISSHSVAQWEKGVSLPSPQNLAKLAEVLHLTVKQLMGREK